MPQLFSTLLILASALLAHAGIQRSEFTGIGHIHVLESDNWSTATLDQKVGCLNDHGKLVSSGSAKCGTFSRLAEYPNTLSTKQGNCTFQDETQERNTDSHYGGSDYAWHCQDDVKQDIYDQLYTLDGFPYVFLCFGDFACYYDAKKAPTENDVFSLWQFHWGSQQMGITPGHIQLLLMWEKTGDLPKREDETRTSNPKLEITEGMQVLLQGARSKD